MSDLLEEPKVPIVFWSWQSDSASSVNRNFIGGCLDKAVKQLAKTHGVVVSVDRDTKGVGGSPSIAETILKKISAADVFVFDATHVHRQPRPGPNPNVALELGYALAVMGENRVIGVRNLAGTPRDEEPPFDFRHRRWPLSYTLYPISGWRWLWVKISSKFCARLERQRSEMREQLVSELVNALKAALAEPRVSAWKSDSDLRTAMRLWVLLQSAELRDWAAFRLSNPQYEAASVLSGFTNYLIKSALPENQFEAVRLRELHEEFRQSLRGYVQISARARVPDRIQRDQFVIVAKAEGERTGRPNDEFYERQVSQICESVRAVWDAWEAYVGELRLRHPEVISLAGVSSAVTGR